MFSNVHMQVSRKIISIFISFFFIFTSITPPSQVYAQFAPQSILNLPIPGTMISSTKDFNPIIIKGLTIHPDNALRFDFLVDEGDLMLDNEGENMVSPLHKESEKLIKYFLAALTTPNKDIWVNLSPYEQDRIIPAKFGETEMGRDMLAQDYMLKQLTASLMYPEDELGKAFWDRVYKKSYELYGTTEVPVNTFNKVWIIPAQADIYENGNSVFVVGSGLKVMLEEDYVAMEKNQTNRRGLIYQTLDEGNINFQKGVMNYAPTNNNFQTKIIRDIIIPEIEKEVNQGKTFANLRQIYNSVILATWYKQNLQESLLGQVYADKGKISGIDVEDKQIKQKIYDQYVESFKKGVYNYIREDYDAETKEVIPRKYFSGGEKFDLSTKLTYLSSGSPVVEKIASSSLTTITADLHGDKETVVSSPTVEVVDEDTSKGYLKKVRNPNLVEFRQHILDIGKHVNRLNKYIVSKLLQFDYIHSRWKSVKLMLEGNLKDVSILFVRSRHNKIKGPTKGGLRRETASDLMHNADFKKRLDRLNRYNPSKEEVQNLVERWITADAQYLSMGMTIKLGILDTSLGGIISKSYFSEKVDVDKVFEKMFEKGWLEKISDDEGILIADLNDIRLEMVKMFGVDYAEVVSVLEQTLGGGKGAIFIGDIVKDDQEKWTLVDYKPWEEMTDDELYAIDRKHSRILTEDGIVGPNTDIPAPDMRVSAKDLNIYNDEYLRVIIEEGVAGNMERVDENMDRELFELLKAVLVNISEKETSGNYRISETSFLKTAFNYLKEYNRPVPGVGVFTGKTEEFGVAGRAKATGEGGMDVFEAFLESKGDNISGKLGAIQGFGNVGTYAALRFVRDGGKLIAISDKGITLIKEEGWSEEEILNMIKASQTKFSEKGQSIGLFEAWKRALFNQDGIKDLGQDEIMGVDVYALILAAGSRTLTGDNVNKVKAKVIVELANHPTENDAAQILLERGVEIIPDVLANAGGAIVSSFETEQAKKGILLKEEDIDKRRKNLLVAAYKKVDEVIKNNLLVTNLREAFFIRSISEINQSWYEKLIYKYKGDLYPLREEIFILGEENVRVKISELIRGIELSGLGAVLAQIWGKNFISLKAETRGILEGQIGGSFDNGDLSELVEQLLNLFSEPFKSLQDELNSEQQRSLARMKVLKIFLLGKNNEQVSEILNYSIQGVIAHKDKVVELIEQQEWKSEVFKNHLLEKLQGSSSLTVTPTGGIDFNPDLINLNIKRDGKGVALPMSEQSLESLMNIEGFVPVIINMVPTTNLPFLLGLNTENVPLNSCTDSEEDTVCDDRSIPINQLEEEVVGI